VRHSSRDRRRNGFTQRKPSLRRSLHGFTQQKPSRSLHGFTLIEVLLVMAILVVLASFAAVNIISARRTAKIDAAKSQVGMFKTPLQMYELAIGAYPTTTQGLEALRTAPGDLPNPSKWYGPYLESAVPMDPWDNPYQYVSPGSHNTDGYDVWSFGPDGVDGTEDDIGNWTAESKR
jgi:general secretion pathway protein G